MKTIKFIALLLFMLLIPLFFVLIDRASHPHHISIATGSTEGAYYFYANAYKKLLAKSDVELRIVPTEGSLDALEKLQSGKVDFALMQSGFENEYAGTKQPLYALANVAYEPVWIFYRGAGADRLGAFRGKSVAVGNPRSGIYTVAKRLLFAAGIDANNTKLLPLGNHEAATALEKGAIDAMFYIASADAKLVQKLLHEEDIRLFDFQSAASYRQYFLKQGEDFHIVRLEKGGFDLPRGIPSRSHTLLAKSTLLMTRYADDEIVRLMMKVVQKVHRRAGIFAEEGTFPNSAGLAKLLHPAAARYFQQPTNYFEENFDFWSAQSLNKLNKFALLILLPLITVFAFFVEVIQPTRHWYSRRKVIRWYDKVNEIDTGIDKLSPEEAQARKDELQKVLERVRQQEDIPAIHMEEFYTLQNQIVHILEALQKRIDYHKLAKTISSEWKRDSESPTGA
ncbi:MAG: hypothetical protein DSZ05_01345 [Sulfurospirillum sp.]|nr:MAG: hypothetical protein DSZ05_01345 [Sulfurospirillum sp.]